MSEIYLRPTTLPAEVPGLLAQQQLTDETTPTVVPPASATVIKPFEQYAAYWTSEPGWGTELQVNDLYERTRPDSYTVQVARYSTGAR